MTLVSITRAPDTGVKRPNVRRHLERGGINTVGVGLMTSQSRAARPAPTLFRETFLGRPSASVGQL